MFVAPAMWMFAAGCAGYPPDFQGTAVWKMFPFDGDRTWDYLSTDLDLPHKLVVTSVDDPASRRGNNVYTLTTVKECFGADEDCVDGELVRRVSWSSSVSDGVLLWDYDIGAGLVEFDPPVQLAKDTMAKDETAETTSGGVAWTSTMLGIESCPIRMTAAWDECGVFELVADGIDGFPLAGKYWATAGNGVAAFELATENGRWELADIDCEGECDGSW